MSSAESSFRVPNALAQRYLEANAGVALTSATVNSYDCHLTEYVSFLHGRNATVISADFDDIVSFIERCVRQGNRKSTIRCKLTAIAELYRFVRLRTDASEELELDPLKFREIDLQRYNTPEPIAREALSKEEIRRLFDACTSYRNRLMIVVGVETGLRNSDIRNLRLQDIDYETLTLHVHSPKNSRPYDVPLSEDLAFELEIWCANHRDGYRSASQSEYVFPSRRGEKLSSNGSLNKIVKDAAERADLQDVIGRSHLTPNEQDVLRTEKASREWHRVTVHTLRHSFITLLEEAGVSLPYRQLVANHTNPDVTLRYSSGASNVFEEIRETDPFR